MEGFLEEKGMSELAPSESCPLMGQEGKESEDHSFQAEGTACASVAGGLTACSETRWISQLTVLSRPTVDSTPGA